MVTLKECAEKTGLVGKGFEDSRGIRYRVEGVIGPNGYGSTGLKVRYVDEGTNIFNREPDARSMGHSLQDVLTDLSSVEIPEHIYNALPTLVGY